MKILVMVIVGLGLVIILWAGVVALQRHAALGRFGVSYVKSGSGEAEHVQFYCRRDGRTVEGPEVSGPDLSIMYQYDNGNEAPLVIVYDKNHEQRHVILKIMRDESGSRLRGIETSGVKVTYPKP